jgi:hypothetical protein
MAREILADIPALATSVFRECQSTMMSFQNLKDDGRGPDGALKSVAR